MILKKQRKQDFILGKLCLFSNEHVSFNNSAKAGYIYFLYIVSGTVILENYYDRKKCQQGDRVDLRSYGDISFKLTAGKHGFLGICVIADDDDDYTNKLFNCFLLNTDEQLDTNKGKFLLSLTEFLEISNKSQTKSISLPPGYVVELEREVEYILSCKKGITHPALIIER